MFLVSTQGKYLIYQRLQTQRLLTFFVSGLGSFDITDCVIYFIQDLLPDTDEVWIKGKEATRQGDSKGFPA